MRRLGYRAGVRVATASSPTDHFVDGYEVRRELPASEQLSEMLAGLAITLAVGARCPRRTVTGAFVALQEARRIRREAAKQLVLSNRRGQRVARASRTVTCWTAWVAATRRAGVTLRTARTAA